MKAVVTDVGSYEIRSIEHGRWYVRVGGEFVLTLTRGLWGVEVCRNRSQDWANFGVVTRFLGIRIGSLWFQFMFGPLNGFVPPDWVPRRASWWCLVTRKNLWPATVLDDVLDAEVINAPD